MKTCSHCNETYDFSNYHKSSSSNDGHDSRCKPCAKIVHDAKNRVKNPIRMYVNGQYVSRNHPLHKPGRYIIDGFFGEAKVESETAKEGFVYCITNPAWPGWVKVGKAVQDYKRFNSYQTYSPMRDYVLEWSHKVDDVHAIEAAFHRGRKADNGEWYEMSTDEALSILQSIPQVGASHV